jgi:predicted dehydrogenase
MVQSSVTRREFLQLTAAAAAMLGLGAADGIAIAAQPEVRKPRPIAPGAKIRFAQVGFRNKGTVDCNSMVEAGAELVALCDVDWSLKAVQDLFAKYPQAKRYKDFRKMLLELDDQIDAVVISTPDHMHFLIAYMAIMMGKHVYVQKPLTQTVWEADELLKLARRHGVCTQMGNQGHAGDGCRRVKEWIQAGVIGPVREVHIWTDRPGKYWKQGYLEKPAAQPIPEGLDWDLFLGRGPANEYNKAFHPHDWRAWHDYGCGALGDMGCHIMDAAFYALELDKVAPTSIEAVTSERSNCSFPKWSRITYKFPPRGDMPEVTLVWSDGGQQPERPRDLEPGRKLSIGGQLIFGEKGTIYDGTDYCESPRLIPEAKMKEMMPHLPKKTIRRPDPVGNPYAEFQQAIKKNDPSWAGSNFEYSVPLAKMVVLGNLAVLSGKRIEWDGKQMKCTNVAEANQYVKPAFRAGWTPEETVKKI